MKTIGLIGGISWHATGKYYSKINQSVNEHFGNNTNPPLIIYNINQFKMHALQKLGDWKGIADMIFEACESLLRGGAEKLVICSNTTHKVYPLLKERCNVPFIHIGDATANYIRKSGYDCAGFIGTKFGMEDPFLTDRIRDFGIKVIAPKEKSSINELHRIIHQELTYNKIVESSKTFVEAEIERMKSEGAQGIILGCTEFSLLFEHMDIDIPIFDTVQVHAEAIVADFLTEPVS